MRSNITYTLDEIAEIYDGPHATPKKLETGDAIFLSISSIENGRLNLEKSSFISEDDFVKWTRRVTPQAGDVVFSYETKIGEASIIPEGLRCCLGRRMGLLRAKQDKVLPQYLLYAYLSPTFQDVIREKTIHGSTTDRISIREMPSFEIQLPDIHTQKKVIQILSSIDNKLSKNAEINQTLEQMVQALFKSWFVNFEPVKAKIAVLEAGGSQKDATLAAMTAISGKDADSLAVFQREYPEKYAELRAIAELFPLAMQDSELGEIPVGWFCTDLSYLALLNNSSWSKKNAPESLKYVDLANTKWGIIHSTEDFLFSDAPSRARRILKPGDTIVGTVAHLADGGAYPAVNAEVILSTPCIIPIDHSSSKNLIECFHYYVRELFAYKHNNLRQNKSLEQLRDTLLPKLLSGEITLPDAEEIAKEADYVQS